MHRENSVQALALDFIDKKDNGSFSRLIKRLKPGLHSFVYKIINDNELAEEIVSKTFISVWEKLHQYNDAYNFSTWVYGIARNETFGELRRLKKVLSHEKLEANHSKVLKIYSPTVNMDLEVVGPSGDNLTQFLADEALDEINNLAEPYKTVMIEREINNKQIKKIAEDLSWNESTVKTRLRKGREDLANLLIKKHPELIDAYRDHAA